MVRRSLFVLSVFSVLGGCSQSPESGTLEEDRSGLQLDPIIVPVNDGADGEVLGRLYHGGQPRNDGLTFTVTLQPVQLDDAQALGGGFVGQFPGVATNRNFHWWWSEPGAGDNHCTLGTAGTPGPNVEGYLSRGDPDPVPVLLREQHFGTATTQEETEIGLENHCVRPGRYLISVLAIEQLPVDYFNVASSNGHKVLIGQAGTSESAYLEPEVYDIGNDWTDLVVNFDDVPNTAYRVAPILDWDHSSGYSLGQFTPGSAQAAPGHHIRVRVKVPVGGDPTENNYLTRLQWEYGSPRAKVTGYYNPHSFGRLLRWHILPTTSTCVVVGADLKHMSLQPEPYPQAYLRIGVDRACYSGPDLVIGDLTAGAGGSTITPSVRISNVTGSSYIGGATITLYLSPDQSFGGDQQIGSQNISLDLDPSETKSLTLNSFSLPTNSQTYYLFAVLSSVTGELETSNNTMWDPQSFQTPSPPLPDLTIAVGNPPATMELGSSANVAVTVSNSGTAQAPAANVRLYWSFDQVLGVGDSLAAQTTTGLVPAFGQWGPTQVSVVARGPVGTKYLIAIVDSTDVIDEQSEGNNTGVSAGQANVIASNLRVTQVLNPLNRMVGAGSPAPVHIHYKNFGTDTAGNNWIGSVALSTDQVYGPGDVVLGTFTPSGALVPGDSGFQSFSFSPPGGTTPGQYYLVAKVDSTGAITESNEGDNTGAGQVMSITANGFQPDVIVDSVTMPWGSSTDEDPVPSLAWMRVWYRNAGNATAPAGYTIRGYTSTNTSCCSGDILVWSIVTTSSLAPGATATAGPKFVPPGGPGSSYYFFGHVNAIPTWGLSEANQINDLKRTTGMFSIVF